MAIIPQDPKGHDRPLRSDQEQFIFAVIRGDMELNETKLANAIHARDLRPATEEEIKTIGAEPGFASPVGLKVKPSECLIVVDEGIPASPTWWPGQPERLSLAEYQLSA